MTYPYVLFDAGGTLLFPDQTLICRLLAEQGVTVDSEQVYAAHFEVLHGYDLMLRSGAVPVPPTLHNFYQHILTHVGVPASQADSVTTALLALHKECSLWTYTKPWVAETLAVLQRAGVQMSVISNSDGRVAESLEACGLAAYFEAIFDSGIVGCEKPDPRLFAHGLDALGLEPSDAIYVGDIYHIDVVGANRAGLGAVHLDPLDLYGDWPGFHVPDIRALPAWLKEYQATPAAFDLFPTDGAA